MAEIPTYLPLRFAEIAMANALAGKCHAVWQEI